MARRFGLGVIFVAWACASTPEDPNVPPVPVYAEDEAPCQYEVLERVRVRRPSGTTSFEDYQRRLRLSLGQAGARVGADAVIAELSDEAGVGVARRREVSRNALPPPPPPGFPGLAVRFVPDTCGA